MRSAAFLVVWMCLSGSLTAAQTAAEDENSRLLIANGIQPTPQGILDYLRPMSEERFRKLIGQLGHRRYGKREEAMKVLSNLPVVPTQSLQEALSSSDPEIRYRAKIVLARTRRGRNTPVLLAVFKTLRGKAYAEAAPVLLDLIPQLNRDDLVLAASEALNSIAQPEHADRLERVLKTSRHSKLRIAALQTLTRLTKEKAVPALTAVMKDSDDDVRMAAAAALVSLKRREALVVLADLLKSEDVSIRAGAVRYLRNATGKRFGYLAIDRSPARKRAADEWIAWVKKFGPSAKLTLGHTDALTSSHTLAVRATLLQKIVGHGSTVYCIEFSPDGKTLASSAGDGKLKLWNVATGKKLWETAGHGGSTIRSVAFSPDGKMLATGSYDRNVKLWNAADGKPLKTLEGHRLSVRIVTFSPDGKWLASSSSDKKVILWDVAAGKSVHVLEGHSSTVRSVTFSPDGTLIASTSSDRTARIWDRKTGTLLKELKGHRSSVRSVDFSPDGKTLVTASLDNSVRLWDVESGLERVKLSGHRSSVKSVVYSPDGRFLVSGGNDRVVRIWDTDTGQNVTTLSGPSSHVWHVDLSPDGTMLAAAGSDRTIHIWKLDLSGNGRTPSVGNGPTKPRPEKTRVAEPPRTAPDPG